MIVITWLTSRWLRLNNTRVDTIVSIHETHFKTNVEVSVRLYSAPEVTVHGSCPTLVVTFDVYVDI